MRRLLVCLGIILVFNGSRFLLAGTLAQFRTALGDIEVELYDQDKPITVQNFIRYVQSGAFQNEFSHRLLPGFVLQGGGFAITNRGTTNWTIVQVPSYPPVTNEFGVGRRFSNVYGTIAMAKLGGDTNSATSQWFFNLANNTFLDAPDTNNLFVVFGHVVRGTNVLNAFNQFQYFNGTQVTNVVYQGFLPPFDTLPLLEIHANLADTNLVFIDVTVLEVGVVSLPAGGHEISWNSPAGMTNVVEFTTNLPPIWNTLVLTNGTGNRMSVNDPSVDPGRFYRVRVAY
jgi:cyclophilin family peptidyl-prolyl cis-trans isomerase